MSQAGSIRVPAVAPAGSPAAPGPGGLTLDAAQRVAFRDLALDHIEHGVCVFDNRQRLVYYNRPYAELYGLSPADLVLGMALRDVVDRRYAVGTGPDMQPDDYAEWRQRIVVYDRVVDTEVQLRDGRTFLIHHEPVDGGGWVATHRDVTGQREAEARIRHMALHDGLTGLPNRAQLTDRLAATLARLRNPVPPDPAAPPAPPLRPDPAGGLMPGQSAQADRPWVVAVLFIDLDHFKDVNDTLGHAAGDELLCQTGDRIAHALGGAGLLARLGGDEFAILLDRPRDARAPGPATLETSDIGQLARAVIASVVSPFTLGLAEARIGASIGIATCTEQQPNLSPALLLGQADMALYRAKAEGRGILRFFDPAMLDALRRRTSLERDLRTALDEHRITPHYQLLHDLRTGTIAGVEALARWTHPIQGQISPAEFISAAETAGLICRLGEQVLRDSCAQAATWNVRLAVNLSPEQVRRPGLIETVRDALQATGLPPTLLDLEITETLLLHDTAPTLLKLRQLRDMGVGIVLDDFGTGYCSLSYLDRFPFTKLKIDRSFVAKLAQGQTAPAIIQAIVTMGHTLALRVSAEGVETQDQLDQLRAMGCDEVQGYLLGRPEPAQAFAARLRRTARATAAR